MIGAWPLRSEDVVYGNRNLFRHLLHELEISVLISP